LACRYFQDREFFYASVIIPTTAVVVNSVRIHHRVWRLRIVTVRPLSRTEVRSIDAQAAKQYGLPTIVLMENAGRGAAEALQRLNEGQTGRALVLCGPGNNGGDGAVVARHLECAGWSVEVGYACNPLKLTGDAAIQREILRRSGFSLIDWTMAIERNHWLPQLLAADWIVDGLLGTGLLREVDGMLAELINSVNASGRPILALDLPSGLDADTGQPLGPTIRATATVTFVAPKLGFSEPGAVEYTGAVEIIGIGAPLALLKQFSVAS
jgi:NAD(P)H-hydrate epimerase